MRFQELIEGEREPLRSELREMFAGFPADAPASPVRLSAGREVIREDDPSGPVYILLEGRVTVVNHLGYADYAVTEFDAVEIFGEYEALCGAQRYLAGVRAKTRCRFLQTTAEAYMEWLLSDSRRMLARMRSMMKSLLLQSARERTSLFLNSARRLERFLAWYYEKNAERLSGALTVAMTRAAVGEELGVSVRTVNRGVRRLAEQGLVTLKSGKITLSGKQYARLKKELENIR